VVVVVVVVMVVVVVVVAVVLVVVVVVMVVMVVAAAAAMFPIMFKRLKGAIVGAHVPNISNAAARPTRSPPARWSGSAFTTSSSRAEHFICEVHDMCMDVLHAATSP
jgi:hypothetical protein